MVDRAIARTGDGVPKYDGSPELLAAYREEALQYLMTFEYKQRYIAGPRLVKELEGTAKLAVRSQTLKDLQWVSHPRGVYTLLQYLEGVVARPSLPEASRFVTKFFYGLQRKRGESMTAWGTRHAESLWEASQALRKVQQEYDPISKASWEPSRKPREMDHGSQGSSNSGPFRDDGRLDEEEDGGHGEWEAHHWRAWSEWSANDSWHSKEFDPPENWDTSSEIFIPEFLAGFLLLHRSGLDANERGNILAIRGEFSTTSVGRALREQWSDDDLAKRDRMKMATAHFAEDDGEEEDAGLMMDEDESGVLSSLSYEAQAAFHEEETKIQEAMTAIRAQKATRSRSSWVVDIFRQNPFRSQGALMAEVKDHVFDAVVPIALQIAQRSHQPSRPRCQ